MSFSRVVHSSTSGPSSASPVSSSSFRSPSSSSPVASSSSSSSSSTSASSSSASPLNFVPGSYPCPSCPQKFTSAPLLVTHANSHNSGLLAGTVDSDALTPLGYSMCHHCSRFFKGLTSHLKHCEPTIASRPSTAAVEENFDVSLEEVFTSYCPTVSFVPSSHRQSWGRVLTAALSDVIAHNSLEAWTRLFMLPKCVLATAKRAGKRNRGDNQTISLLRLGKR